jgi:assimilatory nitrate reductase catalytic subunit
MTRTGLSPRLGAHLPEPFVEIHPGNAAELGLNNGDFARLRSAHGECVLKVRISEGQQHGSLFAPIHWSRTTSSSSHVCNLVAPETDPFSGQPESKATPVSIDPVEFAARGFALTRDPIQQPPGEWWCRVAVKGGHGLFLAGKKEIAAWRDTAAEIFPDRAAEYIDEARGLYRAALFVEGQLEGCLSIGPAATPLAWDSMKALFEAQDPKPVRRIVLSGKSADGIVDPGPLVCACFGIGANTIRTVIEGGAQTTDDVGAVLRAGTNCGSCLPELKRMLSDERQPQAS